MAAVKLTKSVVDGVQSGASNSFVWDSKLSGFGLKVTPKGAKTYVFQYRMGGRGTPTRRYTIGSHGNPWTPDTARDEAERLSVLVRQGVDPVADKQERERKAVDLAFSAIADRFVAEYLKPNWKASSRDGEALLLRHAVPVLGKMRIDKIGKADIADMLRPVRPKVATCRNLFAVTRRLFRWAANEGMIELSPLTGMEAPPLPKSRDRVLTEAELNIVWQASGKLGLPFGPIIRLLVITGQRLEEVAGLDWRELDQAAARWSLPSERAKNGAAHDVPLSSMAVAELDFLGRSNGKEGQWPRRGLIFTTTGETAPSGFSRAKARLDREAGKILAKQGDAADFPAWRFHDLRRTLATGLQALGVRFEVSEAVLNHLSGSKSGVAGVYGRHQWSAEKRAALDLWAGHLAGVIGGAGKVVPIRREDAA